MQEYSTEFHSISRKEKGRAYVSGISEGITLTAIQKNENTPSGIGSGSGSSSVAVGTPVGSRTSSVQDRSSSSGDGHQTSVRSALVQKYVYRFASLNNYSRM